MARRRGWWLRGLLVLLTGGLVYMHGVDPSPTGTHSGATPVTAEGSGHHPDAGGHPSGGHDGRDDREVHLAALCVAVLVSLAAGWLARRRLSRPIRLEPFPAGMTTRLAVASLALELPRLRPPVLAVARC